MAKSGRRGSLHSAHPHKNIDRRVLQVKSFGAHTSHPRRFGAEHFQRQAGTHRPAEVVDIYLAEVSLRTSSIDT